MLYTQFPSWTKYQGPTSVSFGLASWLQLTLVPWPAKHYQPWKRRFDALRSLLFVGTATGLGSKFS